MKKSIKGFSIFLLCLLLLLGSVPMAFAQPAANAQWQYEVLPDGTACITGVSISESKETLAVPAMVDGVAVSTIGADAFCHDWWFQTLIIPEGVTTIEQGAFNLCPITTLYLPSTLKTVGSYAFYSMSIDTVVFPQGIDTVTDCGLGYGIVEDPNHEILPGIPGKNDQFIVYGSSGTAAQTYAADNGFTFVDVDTFSRGDVANSQAGSLPDMADALCLYRAAAGTVQLDPVQTAMADMNGDGAVNTVDAMLLYYSVSASV